MKKHLLITTLLVVMISFTGRAQQQAPLGRFLIGTQPLDFSSGSETNVTQSVNGGSVLSDTMHSSHTVIDAHINLFAGYFITKNILAGVGLSGSTFSQYIRYYLCHPNPDSSKFDLFIQANTTFGYSSTDNAANTQYYPANAEYDYSSASTSDYTITQTTFDFTVGLAVAYNLTRHWSLEAQVGFTYSSSVQNMDSYIVTYTPNPLAVPTPPASSSTYPALKNTTIEDAGSLRFMLSYRI